MSLLHKALAQAAIDRDAAILARQNADGESTAAAPSLPAARALVLQAPAAAGDAPQHAPAVDARTNRALLVTLAFAVVCACGFGFSMKFLASARALAAPGATPAALRMDPDAPLALRLDRRIESLDARRH
jgi:hypothetical protein